jgi:serine/threonine protein kinase
VGFTIRKEVTDDLTVLWLDGVLEGRTRFKRAVDGVEGTMQVMCDGLVRVAAANATPFEELLQHPDAVTYLARLRPAILAGLPRELRAVTTDRVVDFLVDADCDQCDSGEVAVRGELLRRKVAAGPGRCQRCGGRATPRVPSRHLAALRPFAAERVPSEVTRFIDEATRTPPQEESFIESGAMPAVPAPSKYEVLRRIGAGGMAEVFLARQSGLANFSKRVVIKRRLPSGAGDQEFVDMFLREARIAAHIDHPNVVQIFDLGKDGRYHFIAMEYVRGWDLRTVERTALQVEEQMPIEIALRIASDVCSGLSAAHNCRTETGDPLQIIHRDVSPHNVLLSSQGAVKLTDFGISKVSNASLNTKPGVLKGKIIYMAPEQIDDSIGAIDARTDLFAVGLVLHQMLSGKATFRRSSDLHSLEAVLNAPIPDIRETRPDAPPFLSVVLTRALQRDPAERFETARAMQFALEDILVGLGRPSTSATVADWLRGLAEKSGIELSHGGASGDAEGEGLDDGTSALRRLVSRDDGAEAGDDESEGETDIITKNHSLAGKSEP